MDKEVIWQNYHNDKLKRAGACSQKPAVIWLTGLPCSGKSTVANNLDQALFDGGYRSYVLDGDNIRHGLNQDLGFEAKDRDENIRRIGEVAKLFVDAGLIVITAFISPMRAQRESIRALMAEGEFIEIFVDTPVDVCEERDVKGMYKKAREGKIQNFTGVNADYEPPENPELVIRTADSTPQELAAKIIALLREKEILF